MKGQTRHGRDGSGGLNIAASFDMDEVKNYNHESLHRYMKAMLNDEQILHNGAMVMFPNDGKAVIQVKLNKRSISKGVIDEIDGIFDGLGGKIETWVLSDSILEHPEIYK